MTETKRKSDEIVKEVQEKIIMFLNENRLF